MSIRYKSIPVQDSEELNKFLKTHGIVANAEKDESGITLHNGYFIVRYEDGTFDEKLLAKTNIWQALNTFKNNVVVKEIELHTIDAELRDMFKGQDFDDIKNKSKNFFRDYFLQKSNNKLSNEHANELADKVLKSIRDHILADYEINRTKEVSIPIMESLLEAYQ